MLFTNRGYQVSKDTLTTDDITNLKSDLTVTPKLSDDFVIEDPDFKVFHETKNSLFIPRYYGIQRFGIPTFAIDDAPICSMKFNGSLRDQQQSIFNEIFPKIKKYGGGIITLPCGFGKTILSLYITASINLKTIILVHKKFLLDQWIERINEFIPNARVGKIFQSTVDIDNKDIVVAMIQSVAMHDYDKNVFHGFGLIIVDECHHIASKVFSKALYKINTNYTVGLSATPTRKDGLTKVFKWYLGETIYSISNRINDSVVVYKFLFNSSDPNFVEKLQYSPKRGQAPSIAKMINSLVLVDSRNSLLCNVVTSLTKIPDRKILLLSHRVDHLKHLKATVDSMLTELDIHLNTCFYYGDCTLDERKYAESSGDILFATFPMAQEGLDIPRLNTVILATPQKDIVQSIGRAMRKFNPSCPPLIIDICDELSIFPGYTKFKHKIYKSNDYNITDFTVVDDKINLTSDYENHHYSYDPSKPVILDDIFVNLITNKSIKCKKSSNIPNIKYSKKISCGSKVFYIV